jgi:SAM-dependent methyltransferase
VRNISPWIKKYGKIVPQERPVLDMACGAGRHSFFMNSLGCDVVAVDINPVLKGLNDFQNNISVVTADLEQEEWPFRKEEFSGIIVVNYLWRPSFPRIIESLAPGGVLLYDTFSQGNEKFGRPRNPDYLLAPGELMSLCTDDFTIIDFHQGYMDLPAPAVRQSIAAEKKS